MNNHIGADGQEAAVASQLPPSSQQNRQRRQQHTNDEPLHSPSLIPQPSKTYPINAPSQLQEPDDFYKNFNASQNNRTNYDSVHENALTSMASTASKPAASSSRINGIGTLSKNPDLPVQRKEFSNAARSVSDPANPKLHLAKSSPAMKSVKDIASQLQQKAESSKTPLRPPIKQPSKLPGYRQPNGSSSEKSRAVSDTRNSRVGQAPRDLVARVPAPARSIPKSRFTVEGQESSTPASRVGGPIRTIGPRKPVGSSIGKHAPRNSSSPSKSPPKEKALLFGEIPAQSATGVGYGIPTAHARSNSDSETVVIVHAAATDNPSQSPSSSARSAPGEQKSPHQRSHSDTASRRTNGAPTRRPAHHAPSSCSSTSSETLKKIQPTNSRPPTSKRMSDSLISSSTSSTRSNSPLSTRTPQRGVVKPNSRPWSRASNDRSTSRPPYPGHITPGAPRANAPGSPENYSPAQRSSRPYQSVADKSTSASRNRASSQNGSPRSRPPQARTSGRPPRIPHYQSTPLENVDFAQKRNTIREGMHKQAQQTELRRRESLRLTHSQRAVPGIKKEENIEETAEDDKILEMTNKTVTVPIPPEISVEREVKASESPHLRIDTSITLASPVNEKTGEALNRISDDSPTLGVPGSFPSAQTSPMFEEIPRSAVSNASDITDIENEPQDDLQIPGGFNTFNATVPTPESQASTAGTFPNELHHDFKEENDPAGMVRETQLNPGTPATSLGQSTIASEPEKTYNGLGENDVSAAVVGQSGQYLIPGNQEPLLSQVHESLRDPDDESVYERSYAPSNSNARTPQTDRHSAAWTDYSITTGSDGGLDEDVYDRPPTPPPKIISSSHSSFVFTPAEGRPTTPSRFPPTVQSPPLPLSPPVPAVPPKPANYSPLPSPRIVPPPKPLTEDAPLSPRSGFGTASIASSHRRTSSNTPNYAPGTGWITKPPIPTSRPTSMSMEDISNGTPTSVRPLSNTEHDSTSGRVRKPIIPETEEQILAKQKEAKVQRDRDNVVREIIDSEAKHVKDMYVIKEIWQGTADACPKLTERDKSILFANIAEIATFGAKFLEALKKTNGGSSEARRGANSDGRKSLGEGKTNENYDRLTNIGGVFLHFMTEIETVHWPFIINFSNNQSHLEALLKDPAISIWDQECRRAMVDISECWDLKSLLIKPFQRLIKYRDLLERLISKTSPEHPDWVYLQEAVSDLRDMLNRLNKATPPSEPAQPIPKITGKRRETESKRSKMLTLARNKMKTPTVLGNKPSDEDEGYNNLRTTFTDDYVQLQVFLRDVEYYTRSVNDTVKSFVSMCGCAELFTKVPKSSYPELESKWGHFSAVMAGMETNALPVHMAAMRTEVLSPLEQLIELYQNPNLRMTERTKRRADWEKAIQRKGNLTYIKDPKNSSEKKAERYMVLNEQLKRDLPLLSLKKKTIVDICIQRFITLKIGWFKLWAQKLKIAMEDNHIPTNIKSIVGDFLIQFASSTVEDFHLQHTFMDATVKELSICNKLFLKDSPTERSSFTQRSRPPSSGSRTRPAPLSGRARAASINGSPSLPTPDFGRHPDGGFISPSEPPVIPHTLSGFGYPLGLGVFQDNNSMSDTMVNSQATSIHQSSGRPSTSRTSTSRSRPHGYDGAYDDNPRKHSDVSDVPAYPYPTRDSESSYYFRRESDPSERSSDYYDRSRPVSGSTTFSARIDGPPLNGRPPSGLDGPSSLSRPFSGVFQSAMPLSDGTETHNMRMSRTSSFSSVGNDDRGRKDGYNVLYLAASLFEFHISDTKREGIYPYLTYEAGELFDVIGEKGELWLAKNQDDPPDKIKVGWIWSKHFARLAD